VPGRGEPDRAARRAAIVAKYEAKRLEIKADYQAYCEWLRKPWDEWRDPYILAYARAHGEVFMNLEEATAERDRQLRQVDEDELRELELEKKRAEDEPRGAADGEPETRRKPIPDDTFWAIFRRAVEEKASARELATWTDKQPELSFVHRIKAGDVVEWVRAHPILARRALDRQELPKGFSATPNGVIPPER
jgi:hypothetical protein